MKAQFVVSKFGENLEAAWNYAQKELRDKYGTNPTEVQVLEHPKRFGPYKFAQRFLEAEVAERKVRGISARHAETIKQAREAITAGKAVAFLLHGGCAKEVREASGTKRLQGEAYVFFGLVNVSDPALVEAGAAAVKEAASADETPAEEPPATAPATGEVAWSEPESPETPAAERWSELETPAS